MIPKMIHYCWFGRNSMPPEAEKCIASWKKYLPDYRLIEWNEDNFDVGCCEYVAEAYQEKKWAFVSDYARFYVLYKYGGVYFDTDVQVIKNIDDILLEGSFLGMEKNHSGRFEVAPGLGMAAVPGLELYEEMLNLYRKSHFRNLDGSINKIVIGSYTTRVLKQHGLVLEDRYQSVAGINIYPSEYFCPMDYNTGEVKLTENTRSIHHYTGSWHTAEEQKIQRFKQKMTLRFGGNVARFLERCYSLPYRVQKKLSEKGFIGTITWMIKQSRERDKR